MGFQYCKAHLDNSIESEVKNDILGVPYQGSVLDVIPQRGIVQKKDTTRLSEVASKNFSGFGSHPYEKTLMGIENVGIIRYYMQKSARGVNGILGDTNRRMLAER